MKSSMWKNRTYGSVWGAASNGRSDLDICRALHLNPFIQYIQANSISVPIKSFKIHTSNTLQLLWHNHTDNIVLQFIPNIEME